MKDSKDKNNGFVKVKFDTLTDKVVEIDNVLSINKPVFMTMHNYVKTGKLTIENISVGNVIDKSSGKYLVYIAPIEIWEKMIQIQTILSKIDFTISEKLGKETNWVKSKKTINICNKTNKIVEPFVLTATPDIEPTPEDPKVEETTPPESNTPQYKKMNKDQLVSLTKSLNISSEGTVRELVRRLNSYYKALV